MTAPDTVPPDSALRDTADRLARLHALCFTHPRPWSAAAFRGQLASPGTLLLESPVESPSESPGAFLLARIAGPEAEVLTLAVHPDHRRRGLARRLMTRFHDRARNAGATTALLEVAADNTPARALYAALGYAPVGRRPRYVTAPDGTPVDALILRRTLG